MNVHLSLLVDSVSAATKSVVLASLTRVDIRLHLGDLVSINKTHHELHIMMLIFFVNSQCTQSRVTAHKAVQNNHFDLLTITVAPSTSAY